MKKSDLGQFYTKNANYIIGGLVPYISPYLNEQSIIIDPFAGEWDLLNVFSEYTIKAFDIDPKNEKTIKRDTLLDTPDYVNTRKRDL